MAEKDIDGFFTTARVAAREEAVELPGGDYRDFLLDHDDPKLTEVRGLSYDEFTEDRYQAPFLQELLAYWRSLYDEPFVGITSDGVVREGLYELSEMVDVDPEPLRAAERLLKTLSDAERAAVGHPVTANEWRAWSNPEFVVHRVGLRLEDLPAEKIDASWIW